jgi:hypothetical protein
LKRGGDWDARGRRRDLANPFTGIGQDNAAIGLEEELQRKLNLPRVRGLRGYLPGCRVNECQSNRVRLPEIGVVD